MIPVIIGAAALAAGAGYALGKSDTPKKIVVNTVTQKAEVSEDYVKWQLDRAGKDFSQSGGHEQTNDAFESDFKRIDNMLSSSCDRSSINNELQLIELRAKNRRDVAAMNTVANYYERIGHYQKAFNCREKLKTF